jgi:phospholipid-transporting ATPase
LRDLYTFLMEVRSKQYNLWRAINEKVLLLRGAFLKNTEWIIGVVAYTGEDTKITRIAKTPQNKQINIEAKINKLILGILGILNL